MKRPKAKDYATAVDYVGALEKYIDNLESVLDNVAWSIVERK